MFDLCPSTVKLAHLFISQKVRAGFIVVDATVGNGHDTLFLAQLVGEKGEVIGFDIQEEAINNTKEKLKEAEVLNRVNLFHAGHEKMEQLIEKNVDAIMFNLGYRPGGDHAIITKPDTTLKALADSINLLKPGGIITVVVYPGHSGGDEEAQKIDSYLSVLDKSIFSVIKTGFINRSNTTPYLIVIEKTQA